MFSGKASWAVGLVPELKPVVGSCRATLAETSRREANIGSEGRGWRPEEALVASRQVRRGLPWLHVFFLRQIGTLEKVFEWGLWGTATR